MQKIYLMSIITATLLLSGCGTQGTSSNDGNKEVQNSTNLPTTEDTTQTESTEDKEQNNNNSSTTEDRTQAESTEDKEYNNNNSSTTEDITQEESAADIVDASINYHHQGTSCASCHNPDKDNDEVFDSGATIFTTITAANYSKKATSNYTLRILLESGEIVKYNTGRGTGNFNRSFNAGINNYTPQVLDAQGNIVNASLLNSHNTARFDCNSCHTPTGTNSAPGRVVSYDYYATVDTPTTPTTTTPKPKKSFANDVEPILNSKCASCHGSSGSFSITHSNTPYDGVTPWINKTDASNSRLLLKATNTKGHGGGSIITTTSTAYSTIRDWIEEGALNN